MLQEAAPDPGMQPKRYTHERARGPSDLHLSAPAAIPGAIPGGARADRPRPRAQPLNPLEPAYPWYPVRTGSSLLWSWCMQEGGHASSLLSCLSRHGCAQFQPMCVFHTLLPTRCVHERQEAVPPPKFVRDTLDITDIAGAKVG